MNLKNALERKIAFKTLDELLTFYEKTKEDVKTVNLSWFNKQYSYIKKDDKEIEFYYCNKCEAYIVGSPYFIPPDSFYREINPDPECPKEIICCRSGDKPSYECNICGTKIR
ncbi:Uncharacterised protein [Candidatus Tiddalikarchaeum anstoanum]|nr:Uncharacterised protein [Candidatus Tiddalikarchaeum anstoanum]